MASLTPEQVLHIAKLARLKLSPEEVQKMSTELSNILTYIDVLKEVNTDKIEPTSQITGITNGLREDTVRETPIASADDLLKCSGLPIIDHQIASPHAHG